MPLVWELTSELKAWLTPDKLRGLNTQWRANGRGFPDAVIETVIRILVLPNVHYEAILGQLEVQYRRFSADSDHYHALYSILLEVVYWILQLRHINNAEHIRRNLRYLDGVVRLTEENLPLWVFSLNHDLLVECLAADHDIPLNSGFTPSVVTL